MAVRPREACSKSAAGVGLAKHIRRMQTGFPGKAPGQASPFAPTCSTTAPDEVVFSLEDDLIELEAPPSEASGVAPTLVLMAQRNP